MMLMVTLGLVTPPVGVSMYTVCSILECPIENYVKASIPFIATIILVDIIIIFLPDIYDRDPAVLKALDGDFVFTPPAGMPEWAQ